MIRSLLPVAIACAMFFFNACSVIFPLKKEPPENITIEPTPDRLSRGEYIFNHVAVCADCHSTRNFNLYAGPLVAGTLGCGGELFDESFGIPGKIYPKNITPSALKKWSDGEIIRAITAGIDRDDKEIFPMMPFQNFKHMSQEDVYSVVAFVRTLKPIEKKIPKKEVNFPVNYFTRTIPKPWVPEAAPNRSDPVAYGKYLVMVAGCSDCHTPMVRGKLVASKAFSGGKFHLPGGEVYPSNITPDSATGIGQLSKENFVGRFKAFASEEACVIPVPESERASAQTFMPWTFYAGMTEEDLGAIYSYLRTVKPISRQVKKFAALGVLQKNNKLK